MASTSKQAKINLRSSDSFVFLVGNCEEHILGSKLPSKRKVLQTLYYHIRNNKLQVNESARLVIDEVLQFWNKARLPTLSEDNCFKKLKKLYGDLRNVQKNSKSKYRTCQQKVKNFEADLETLFDVAHLDALTLITVEEDRQFLLKQREPGLVGSMIGIDMNLTLKEQRKMKRMASEEHRKEKRLTQEAERSSASHFTENFDFDHSEENDFIEEAMECSGNNDDYALANAPKLENTEQRMRGKHHFIDDRMLACMDFENMSTPGAIRFISATAAALGHDVSKLVLNRTSVHRMRTSFRARQAKDMLDNYEIPRTFVIHWDSKLLPELTGRGKHDRLAVVLTSDRNDKLLGIPIIKDGSGESIAEAVFKLLNNWKIADLTAIVCFDTTSSNTGRLNGAVIRLEEFLGHSLLKFPCRRHVSELMLRAIFEAFFAISSAPEVTAFDRFGKQWKNIDITKYESGMSDEITKKSISFEECEELIAFCRLHLQDRQPRGDYKELLELAILFLGSGVYKLRTPGAISHARFMAKAIYSFKMFLFRNQFQMAKKELDGLREICIFLIRIYIKYWFQCDKAIEAPFQDLTLIKQIVNYPVPKVSAALVDKFRRHMSFLSEEPAAFAFFDQQVPLETKKKMLTALHLDDEDYTDCRTRDVVSIEEFKSFARRDLSDFITTNSKGLFHRLEIKMDFLKCDPSTWSDREDFAKGILICESIHVVNDPAERAVKLITEYNRTLTQDEEERQYLLQVREYYKDNWPTHKKSDLLN